VAKNIQNKISNFRTLVLKVKKWVFSEVVPLVEELRSDVEGVPLKNFWFKTTH
jgi:hypothetical protein